MRLEKLPAAMAKRLAELECLNFTTTPWVEGKPLPERRVAIVSSAGLVVRGDKVFRGRDSDYRAIPNPPASVVQPYLDQFRPHRVPGGLERDIPA